MVQVAVLDQIRSMPRLHLFDYQQADGASMYANFVQAVWEDLCFTQPTSVDLSALGEYQFARAEGSQLNLAQADLKSPPEDYGGKSGLIDWLMDESLSRPRGNRNTLLTFEALALVVCSADVCIADVSTMDEHFRQVFYRGRATSPCDRSSTNRLPLGSPFVQLLFTLGSPMFESSLVLPSQLRKVVRDLRRHHMLRNDVVLGKVKSTQDGWRVSMRLSAKSSG